MTTVRILLLAALCLLAHSAANLPQQVTIQLRPVPRSLVEARLQRHAKKNEERAKNLKLIFEEAGCREFLREQPVKGSRLPNLICVLQGSTDSLIVVGAHYDHSGQGTGVADNWSGAGLLPSLFQTLSGEPRKHTFVFVGFSDEEKGLAGSSFYVKQLTPEQINKTRVMVNLDTLGMGPTNVWLSRSDKALAGTLNGIAESLKLPLRAVDGDQVGDEDSTPFRKKKIRAVVLHSITQETLAVLHSSKDTISTIRMDDYYGTYRLISAYLAFLDDMAWEQMKTADK